MLSNAELARLRTDLADWKGKAQLWSVELCDARLEAKRYADCLRHILDLLADDTTAAHTCACIADWIEQEAPEIIPPASDEQGDPRLQPEVFK